MVIAAGDPLKGKPCSSHEWVEDVALGDPQDSDDEEQAEDDGAAQGRPSLPRREGGDMHYWHGAAVFVSTHHVCCMQS